jgi:hypothetical protein
MTRAQNATPRKILILFVLFILTMAAANNSKSAQQEHGKTKSPCCPGGSCGPVLVAENTTRSLIDPVDDSSLWKRAPHAQDQFATYPSSPGKRVDAKPNGNVVAAASMEEAKLEKEDPWDYSDERLQALQFPLGGFGERQ